MLENNTNQKLHDLLISRDFEPEALNNQGKPAASPDQADLFSFNYKGEEGSGAGSVLTKRPQGGGGSIWLPMRNKLKLLN